MKAASGMAYAAALAAPVLSPAMAAPPVTTRLADPVLTDINVSGPFLQNLTKDPHNPAASWRCGEGQITLDVRNPKTLIMSCMSINMNYQTAMTGPFFPEEGRLRPDQYNAVCYTFISRNGGNSWQRLLPNPLQDPVNNVCVDPLAEHGPNGELYLGSDALRYPADGKTGHVPPTTTQPWGFAGIVMTRSLDGGRTWSKLSSVPTGVDRPFWTVDQSTGAIYEVSACNHFTTTPGDYGCLTTTRNLTVSTDRGKTWSPTMDIFSTELPTRTFTPGRLHDISFPGGGYAIGAAHGVFATAGFNAPGAEPAGGLGARGAIGSATFKYSTDLGVTFTERPIPLVADSATCDSPSIEALAADPTRRGGFAIAIICTPTQKLRVYVTRDLGQTWTKSADLASVPPAVFVKDKPEDRGFPTKRVATNFDINRPALAYGPSGALAVVWRQTYGAPLPRRQRPNGPQDVFVAIAADGMGFGAPFRVNTAASPPGDPRFTGGQELTGLVLDKRYVYATWDDWRSGEMQTWFRKVPIPAR